MQHNKCVPGSIQIWFWILDREEGERRREKGCRGRKTATAISFIVKSYLRNFVTK